MLIHKNSCREHAELPDLEFQIGFMDERYESDIVYDFSEVVVEDPRLTNGSGSNQIVTIVLAEMEVIIKDEDDDAIEKFEYDNSDEVPDKTERAVDWIVQHYN